MVLPLSPLYRGSEGFTYLPKVTVTQLQKVPPIQTQSVSSKTSGLNRFALLAPVSFVIINAIKDGTRATREVEGR